MLQIHYKGILIGDCVYTDILRHASQVYTINKTMWKRDFPVLLKAFIYCNCIWAYILLEILCNKDFQKANEYRRIEATVLIDFSFYHK